MAMVDIMDVPLTRGDGSVTTLRQWEGHAILLVILPRDVDDELLADYAELWDEFMNRGFYVVGVMTSLSTGAEENALIPRWLAERSEGFPILLDSARHGASALFEALSEFTHNSHPAQVGDMFVLDDAGRVAASFDSGVEPDDDELVEAIESALPL